MKRGRHRCRPRIVQRLLREELGYQGVILSDDLEMKAIADKYAVPSAAVLAVEAGCDGVLICGGDHDVQAARRSKRSSTRSRTDRLRFVARRGRVEASAARQGALSRGSLAGEAAIRARRFANSWAVTSTAPSPTRWRASCDAETSRPPAWRSTRRRGANGHARSPATEFDRGVEEVRRLGFEPVYDESVFARRGFVAGEPASRVKALHAAWADPTIGGIISVRGGYGSVQLLPMLDADLAFRARKPFIGYSDLTTILTFLTIGCNLVAFHGPMLAGRLGAGESRYDRESLLHAVCRREPMGELAPLELETIRRGATRRASFSAELISQIAGSLGTPFGRSRRRTATSCSSTRSASGRTRLDRMSCDSFARPACWRAPAPS